jgi:hypothetical protein
MSHHRVAVQNCSSPQIVLRSSAANRSVRVRGVGVWLTNPLPTRHSSWRSMNCQRVAKIEQLRRGYFCETRAMTTKTIPEYLEDERRKHRDTQLRMEEEAARIQPLNHGHHRTAKQPKLELPSSVRAAPKARKIGVASRKKPRTARRTATKARKAA